MTRLGWNRVLTDFVLDVTKYLTGLLEKRKGLCLSQPDKGRQGNLIVHTVAIWEAEKEGC